MVGLANLGANLGWLFIIAALAGGAWMLFQCSGFIRNPKAKRGGLLFLQASWYRGVLFAALVTDIVLSVIL